MAENKPTHKQTKKELSKFAKKLLSDFKGELIGNNKVASYGLVNSLELKFNDGVSSIQIDFLYVPYGKWIETGQKPHWVPIQPLKDWAKLKGKDDSFAYAVRQKIKDEGVKPFPFVDNIIQASNVETNLENILLEAFGDDLDIQLKSMLDKNVKEYFDNKTK